MRCTNLWNILPWLALLLPAVSTAFAQSSPIYINILVHDASEVVKGKVKETVGGSKLPGPLKRVATFVGSGLASKAATPSRIAEKMSGKMPNKMTEKMKGNGLDVKVEPFFREGPYLVLKLAVLKVHLEKLSETAMREKLGKTDTSVPTWVRRFEALTGEKTQAKLESDIVPGIVASKMTSEMPKMMGTKLASKGMVADVDVISEKDQDAFFEKKLKEARALAGGNGDEL